MLLKKLLSIVFLFLIMPVLVRADHFEEYTNQVLQKMVADGFCKESDSISLKDIADLDSVLPGIQAGFIIVKTNDGRFSRSLVQFARQKIDANNATPMILLERFTTYREGEERTVLASSKNVALFSKFRFSFDLGQVVPSELGGDILFESDKGTPKISPLGKAKLFLVTKAHPDAKPMKKDNAVTVGPTFDMKYFNGTYQLNDDGRRTGKLILKVDELGEVLGSFYSDKDGQKYEVRGKAGAPPHAIQFIIKFPRIEQNFQGFLFTSDAKAIAGSSKLVDRDSAFYAIRVE